MVMPRLLLRCAGLVGYTPLQLVQGGYSHAAAAAVAMAAARWVHRHSEQEHIEQRQLAGSPVACSAPEAGLQCACSTSERDVCVLNLCCSVSMVTHELLPLCSLKGNLPCTSVAMQLQLVILVAQELEQQHTAATPDWHAW